MDNGSPTALLVDFGGVLTTFYPNECRETGPELWVECYAEPVELTESLRAGARLGSPA